MVHRDVFFNLESDIEKGRLCSHMKDGVFYPLVSINMIRNNKLKENYELLTKEIYEYIEAKMLEDIVNDKP